MGLVDAKYHGVLTRMTKTKISGTLSRGESIAGRFEALPIVGDRFYFLADEGFLSHTSGVEACETMRKDGNLYRITFSTLRGLTYEIVNITEVRDENHSGSS